jgi:hypothetical protein
MGYRDNFYVVGSIIGFTGILHQSPTVYFHAGTEFGHITQNHWFEANCGREDVGSDPGYTIGNETQPNGIRASVERCSGVVIHSSRSLYTAVNPTEVNTIALLAQAIIAFPEKKRVPLYASLMGAYKDNDLEQVLETLDNRQQANAQIRAGLPRLRHVQPSMMKGSGA